MDDDMYQRLVSLLNRSIKEKVEANRAFAETDTATFYPVLDGRLQEFFRMHPSEDQFPAIDIGSGHGGYVVHMALHFRPPIFQKKLVWYATDWTGDQNPNGGPLETETRAALKYCIKESVEKVENVLFTDKNGKPVYEGDGVQLAGLKSVQFNGKRGQAQGLDPKAEGRIAVQVSADVNDKKSFRRENITYLGETSIEDVVLRSMRIDGSHVEFFKGLLDRTREIDILKKDTWSNLHELEGKCALVTCSSLLTCLGYREPTAWQDTMEFASTFLCKDGLLLQYDAIDYGGFGDQEVMDAFVGEKFLGLKLEDVIQEGCYQRTDGTELKCFLWRKI